jgi:hypothetical protein
VALERLNYCDTSCELGWADESFDDGYARTAPVGSYPDRESEYEWAINGTANEV